jgi:hypothetical protein
VANTNTSSGGDSGGFEISTGSTLVNCSADNNTSTGGATSGNGYGIFADSSTVEHCSVFQNKGDGIAVLNDCFVSANLAVGNGNGGDGAGVHASGDGNRIEGNYVEGNDRGVDVTSTNNPKGNLVIKNGARSNGTNYKIAADNRYGPIIDITAAGAATVNGSSAISTVASTDPWANFSH